jgi:hypothetical protein
MIDPASLKQVERGDEAGRQLSALLRRGIRALSFYKKNHYGPLCELGRTVIQNIYVLGYVKPNENS